MRSVADMSRQELEQFLSNEIASARAEARPISRMTLSRMLQSQYTMNPHEAERFVDRYCDEKAPGVPTYLSSEFGVPYLKVLAVLNTVLAIGLAITAAIAMRRGVGNGFIVWLGAAVLFSAGAAFCWVQSVRPQRDKRKGTTTTATSLPTVTFQTDPLKEPASTGSYQSNS